MAAFACGMSVFLMAVAGVALTVSNIANGARLWGLLLSSAAGLVWGLHSLTSAGST